MEILDVILSYLPTDRKQTPSGWIKFNAVCCTHNGTSADTRSRGGIIQNAEGISYHCFNCGFKTGYIVGHHISKKMRKLLEWLRIPTDIINKIILESLRFEEHQQAQSLFSLPTFEDRVLPKTSILLKDAIDQYPESVKAANYLLERGLLLDEYPWCWSSQYSNRIIVPYFFENRIVGWTARKITDGKPKYISDQQPGYIFNLDRQHDARKLVIVTEGPFDAISIDGVALLGSEVSVHQQYLLNKLNKSIIVLPDRDSAGKKLIDFAIENNWAVSMPEWSENINDANDALRQYGRIYTLHSIIKAAESYHLKIRLKMKKWFDRGN